MKYSALGLLLAARVFAAESALPDFLPPGTKVMFGFQVRRILSSPLTQALNSSGELPGAGVMGADWQKIVWLTGFDPFKDIDELLIASAAEGQKPPMLLIARGNFNVERFSANAKPYHSVPVLVTGKNSTGTVALLDASTAILGEIAEVRAAIDRRGSGVPIHAALASTVASLRARYEIWGLGEGIDNLVPQLLQPDGMNSVDRFQFGLSITNDLELAAELHARSAKDAEKLMLSLQFLELIMKSQLGAKSTKLEIHEDHGTVKLALTISGAELQQALEAQRAAPVQKPVDSQVKITAPAEPPQTKPPATGANTSTGVVTLPGKHY